MKHFACLLVALVLVGPILVVATAVLVFRSGCEAATDFSNWLDS